LRYRIVDVEANEPAEQEVEDEPLHQLVLDRIVKNTCSNRVWFGVPEAPHRGPNFTPAYPRFVCESKYFNGEE
jgi:hypothetical protein